MFSVHKLGLDHVGLKFVSDFGFKIYSQIHLSFYCGQLGNEGFLDTFLSSHTSCVFNSFTPLKPQMLFL